ncbi:hypothetical protein N7495_002724 [Penicillium taxi]|uniref:uncharacterized protein n=1 Tax=Penicillium taxi TaxID=168475 RepID=UPI002545ADC1|nr:uncharacterized protein N7495_002724 [Penicillium taxi]KAJ5902196.1 hypothetical protein N7495_002724 [Penicillium taxi]
MAMSKSPAKPPESSANHLISNGRSGLDLSLSSAISASVPSLSPNDVRILHHQSRLAPSLLLSSPPGDSSPSDSASPKQSPRSIALEPPPLPFLLNYRGQGETRASSPENRRPESSVYYTTTWGSPYAARSSRRLSLTLSQYAGFDQPSGESSPDLSELNQPEFRRASVAVNSHDIVGYREGGKLTERKSIRDFTQDWIDQYLSGQPRTERGNWLSDDSGSETPSFTTALNQPADDLSDWLGLEDDIRDDKSDILKTPRPSDFASRRAEKKPSHKRADTLRQADFWGFAYDKESPKNMSISQGSFPDHEVIPAGENPFAPVEVEKLVSPTEKPLPLVETEKPLPPAETEKPLPPAETEKPLPLPPADEAENLQSTEEHVPQSQTSKMTTAIAKTPRRRKKMACKGKVCIIDLPVDDIRGSAESRLRLLTPEDVEERMRAWEEEGYDVRGFTIGSEDDPSQLTELGSLSRPLFPDPFEVYEETKGQKAFIRFPDRRVWDAYVQNLQEEKLRALGVSFGDNEPVPSISPAPEMRNQPQMPFGLIGSPPLPTASAAGNPLGPIHNFSPAFGQSAGTLSGGIGSLTSPASQFSVQTPYLGVDGHNMPNGGFPFQYQPTPPAQGAITPQSLINLRQGNSSVGPGGLSYNSMLSPISPLHEQTFHNGYYDITPHDKNIHDGPPFPTPQTPVNGDQFHTSNIEIAHPTPRGHGHNLSENLQRGLDQMTHPEYHLDKSTDHHYNEGGHDPNHNALNANLYKSHWTGQDHQIQDPSRRPSHVFSQTPQQFFPEQYGQLNAHEGSDLDTNPSISGTPHPQVIPNQAPWHEAVTSAGSYQGHHPKNSTSSLNVEAKEFDPSTSFVPQPGPFGNGFKFGGAAQQTYGFAPNAASFHNHSAPENPLAATHTSPQPSSFKFSAASFNVEAPVFNPTGSLASNISSEQPSANRTKIFDEVSLSDISKPSKASKAIPIVRPDEIELNHQKAGGEEVRDDNEQNGRSKRSRVGLGHVQGEARYSISTHPLGETGNVQAPSALHAVAEGKENALPEQDYVERRGTPTSEADTWTLFDVEHKHGGRSSTTSPLQKLADFNKRGSLAAIDTNHATKDKSTILSPTAAPFEFKTAVPAFVPTTDQKSATEQVVTSPSVLSLGGLMASRYATLPATSPSQQPAQMTTPMKLPQSATPQQKLEYYRESAEESPDDDELNAIMAQLNDDSDVGIQRDAHTTPLPSKFVSESGGGPTKEKPFGPAELRSEAPSPSPGGGHKSYKLTIPNLGSDIDIQTNATFSPHKSLITRLQSPVRQFISENNHVSDWDDMISSGEDEKFLNRNRFFDRRINDIVGSAIDDRFTPMERALAVIQQSIASIASGTASRRALRSTSTEIEMEDSDADDEDDNEDVEGSVRTRSPPHKRTRDRKLDMLKGVVMEALATQALPQRNAHHSSHSEMAQLRESVLELQALTIKNLAQDPVGDMREILEQSLMKQLAHQTAQQSPRLSEAEEIGADSLMLQIDGLKRMLRLADERADNEYNARRDVQDNMNTLQHLLKVAEEDAARHSAAAEDAESRLLHFKEEKIPHLEKMQFLTQSLSEEGETLKLTIAELSAKNIALEGTLDEYRVSSDSFRRRLQDSKEENKSLHETVDHLRTRIEDSMVARHNLTEKFDRLQTDMETATADIIRDQATWRQKTEAQNAKYNELSASHAREVVLRGQLEQDVIAFEQREREAAKLKFVHEQTLQENVRLEEVIANLRSDNHDLELKSARFEREFNEARESSRMEIQRTRNSMEADLEASNSQVNFVRAELEAQIMRLESQLDNARMDADTSRERFEMLLEDANESKMTAVALAKESRDLALEEQRKTHERVLNDLRERHARALHNTSEDRQRGEANMEERMAITNERVQLLTEKLEIAQSAARAAAQAARSGKTAPSVPTHSSAPSMSFNQGSGPDKISPQALRESIFVLQDQLQQRETRIEELEQEVSTLDKDAPKKIKERDSEITWLRELLGVRMDDLQDIIRTLSQPTFNKHAARDAAIRLKANLQMQQQERDRAVAGQSFPSISDLAASPRSLPLAAAAAWGNWRKGRETANPASDQTPSKPSNTSSFLSGLLTPPSSHVRQNAPKPTAPGRSFAETRPLRGINQQVLNPPQTPPLMRRSSYDHDAEPGNYEYNNFTPDDLESTVDGMVSASPKSSDEDGPFGPEILTREEEEGEEEEEEEEGEL